mgnify:CR=1 FL=1
MILKSTRRSNFEWAYKLFDVILSDLGRTLSFASRIVGYTKRLEQINSKIDQINKGIIEPIFMEGMGEDPEEERDLEEWRLSKGLLKIA